MGAAATVRYRGLHLPRHPGLLPEATAAALAGGRWQPALTEAAFTLARPDDRVAVLGSGCGHLVAVLAGKLGLPHVHIVEPDPERQRHIAAIARANGLPRLAFAAAGALPALRPALLFADLSALPDLSAPDLFPPDLAALPGLRAAAVDVGAAPASAVMRALFAAAEAAGLGYDPTLSAGTGLVLRRL